MELLVFICGYFFGSIVCLACFYIGYKLGGDEDDD